MAKQHFKILSATINQVTMAPATKYLEGKWCNAPFSMWKKNTSMSSIDRLYKWWLWTIQYTFHSHLDPALSSSPSSSSYATIYSWDQPLQSSLDFPLLLRIAFVRQSTYRSVQLINTGTSYSESQFSWEEQWCCRECALQRAVGSYLRSSRAVWNLFLTLFTETDTASFYY